jgi:uncharacterized protein (TIGR02265 family)
MPSPFLIKGHVYAAAKGFYALRVPGGNEAVGRALGDREVKAFFAQTFAGAGEYDVLPFVAISRAAAGVAGVEHRQLVVENSRWLANRDVNGIYRLLLRLASPERVAMRLPKAATQYFNFGEVTARMSGERSMEAQLRGVPAALASWMLWCVEGFTPVALQLAGAKDVRVRIKPETATDGELGDHRTLSLSWGITWR